MAAKKNTVIRQASFLMIATLICRVIGLLYRSPLHTIMGDVGDGYYTFAFEWYSIILLIASYSIPMAVSKVMAERLAKKQYRNAQKVFRAAFLYVIIVGGAAAVFAFFGAPFLLAKQPGAVLALRVLAPTIFLSGILGVLRGFFQAHNTMMPTAISQIAEQIVNAVVSVLAAWIFTRAVAGGSEALVGSRGAAGGTLGTGAGVVTGILFMLLIFTVNRRTVAKRAARDTDSPEESYGEVFRTILMMVTPVILATCVYNVSGVIDQTIFTHLMPLKGFSETQISAQYALFGYRFRPIINIPIALASATSTALIPAVAASIASRKTADAKAKIAESVRFMMFLAIPSAVGLCILSYPVIRILYPGGDVKGAAILLSLGAVSVIFYCLSTVTNGALQGLGKPSIPVRNAAIALGVNALAVVIGVWFLNMGVAAVLLATVLYALTVSFLNTISVRKYLPYQTDIKASYVMPMLASALMGAVIGALYWLPAKFLPNLLGGYIVNAVWTLLVVLIGIVVYAVAFVKLTGKTEAELKQMPMGTRIVQLLHLLHIRV